MARFLFLSICCSIISMVIFMGLSIASCIVLLLNLQETDTEMIMLELFVNSIVVIALLMFLVYAIIWMAVFGRVLFGEEIDVMNVLTEILLFM